MKTSLRILAALALVACGTTLSHAATYITAKPATGTYIWDATDSWTDGTGTATTAHPDAPGDIVIFNDVAVGSDAPAQTGNRIYNLNSGTNTNNFTVGEIDFNLAENTSASRRDTIGSGPGGNLIMDVDGAGPLKAKIVVNASTTTFNIAQMVGTLQLNDDAEFTIPQTGRGDFGLRFMTTAKITGSGGITRIGPTNSIWNMQPTSGTDPMSYTGPTVLDGGRTVMNVLGQPASSSSFTIQGNAQLEPTEDGTYAFGNGTLHLNSDGTGNVGIFGINGGVIRPSRLTTGGNHPARITITNPSVSLEAPINLIHSEGFSDNGSDPSFGFIQFNGVISGGSGNKLQLTTTSHSQNHGTYVLAGANTFSGGIDLQGGRLSTDMLNDSGNFNSSTLTANPNATFGTGDIHAFSTPSNVGLAVSRVTIPSGVLNAIGNHATLWIEGNADWGRSAFAELGDGVTEVVGKLKLAIAGNTQLSGVTYGSTSSSAMFQDDTYFTGTGVVQVSALGDFDGNGSVGAEDYAVWRKSYSGNSALYDLWRANFGNTNPGSGSGGGLSASAVPEPSTFMLLTLTIAPLLLNQRRRVA